MRGMRLIKREKAQVGNLRQKGKNNDYPNNRSFHRCPYRLYFGPLVSNLDQGTIVNIDPFMFLVGKKVWSEDFENLFLSLERNGVFV